MLCRRTVSCVDYSSLNEYESECKWCERMSGVRVMGGFERMDSVSDVRVCRM